MNKPLALLVAFSAAAAGLTGCAAVQEKAASAVGAAPHIRAVIEQADDSLQSLSCDAGKAIMTVLDPCNNILVTKVGDQVQLTVTPKGSVARADADTCANVWGGIVADVTSFSLKSFVRDAQNSSSFGNLTVAARGGFVTGVSVNYNQKPDLVARLSTTKFESLAKADAALGGGRIARMLMQGVLNLLSHNLSTSQNIFCIISVNQLDHRFYEGGRGAILVAPRSFYPTAHRCT